ncbi:hypothetical protein FRB90_003313 [Tulasnella sp. 427]|nr:hypothetical protein FRB90_003313 [Tulasnella sp. 427]
MPPVSLDSLPTDVLAIVAADLAALHTRGPPAAVYTGLLQASRAISATRSPHLDSLVFQLQFDTQAIKRRLPDPITTSAFQHELLRRWKSLKRIRWAASAGTYVWGNTYDRTSMVEDMWVAFLCLIENDGKNWEQVVGWAMLPAYIQTYVQWDLGPASNGHELPEETEARSLGLWLLWFLSDNHSSSVFRSYMSFPLPIAAPLASEAAHYLFYARTFPPDPTAGPHAIPPSSVVDTGELGNEPWDSTRYDGDWARLTTDWTASPASIRSMPPPGFVYVPGSLTGIFQGTFLISDFGTYQRLERGDAPMPTYDAAVILAHTQAWKIKEHYCPATRRDTPHPNEAAVETWNNRARVDPRKKLITSTRPFRHGPALRAHLPENLTFGWMDGGCLASTPEETVLYRTWQPSTTSDHAAEDLEDDADEYIEILITGEAVEPLQGLLLPTMMHPGSSLRGTVRRKDGLITLWAVPRDRPSGQWLYIGHLTDDGNSWIGRWRSLQEDARSLVWEGLFRMHRR